MIHRLNLAIFLALAAATPAISAQPSPPAAAETIRPEADPEAEDNLQWAASVVEITPLRQQGDLGGKLFGSAGGDPAMNGLYTYLAFYVSPADGWRIFRIGDFNSYTVVSETEGQLVLEVNENVMNANDEIGSRVRRLRIGWTPGRDGAPPETVTVAPAPTP